MNIKKTRVAFVKRVTKFLTDNGAQFMDVSVTGTTTYRTSNCEINIESEEHHKNVFSIFCRFDECNELTGNLNSKFNWHSYYDCGWESHLNEVFNKGR